MQISPEDVISILYSAILGRKPESKGMQAHLSKHNQTQDIGQFLYLTTRSIITSSEFTSLMQRKLFEHKFFVEHSQHGETEIVLRKLVSIGMHATGASKIIVDVGASGKEISNSYDLLKHFDIKGILIEANPERCEVIRDQFKGLDVDVLNAAVSDTEKDVVLWVNNDNTHIASIQHQRIEDWRRRENFASLTIDREYRLRSQRLHRILDEHNVPHEFLLLSIDIEGEDINVLNDLFENSLYTPYFLIVEGNIEIITKKSPSLIEKYALVASTASNCIFCRALK